MGGKAPLLLVIELEEFEYPCEGPDGKALEVDEDPKNLRVVEKSLDGNRRFDVNCKGC